ncbi:MAG: ABC transporter permease [Salinivirgaceae bacterium]|nr:ABC transporter permease [Salinivirgaceae bacterium]MDY0279103.1 ABC transporter permease [Salinivirgaceae bacterium]
MFDIDRWKEIIHTLKSNKMRTLLTAFGVFWGIFMLIVMLGVGNGLHNGIYKNMGDFATNSAFMWTQNTTKPFAGFNKGRRWNFRNGDVDALRNNVVGLERLAPRVQGTGGSGANNAVYGKNTGSFSIYGDYPDWNFIDPVDIVSGRFINDMDIINYRKIAVIGKRVKELLFEKDEDPMDKFIRINGVYFKVVGVFESKKGAGQAENEEQNIHLPFTTVQRVYNYGDIIFFFALTADPKVSVATVAEETMKILRKRHKIHPEDDRAMGYFNVEKEFKKVAGLFMGINLLIWIVGIGTLLAGAIGVSNIMLVVVRERTNELGIRRAIGASPINIIVQIIWESVVLTVSAGWAGLVAGVGIIQIIYLATFDAQQSIIYRPIINFNIALIALTVLVISGIIAGLIPAYRAVKMKPIDALRSE